MKIRPAIALCLAGTLATAAPNSAYEVGKVEASQGAISLVVMEIGGNRTGAVYVRDRHSIKTNLVPLDRQRLIELRDLVDKTIAELDAPR